MSEIAPDQISDVAEWGDRVIVYEGETVEEIMRLYPELTRAEAEELAKATVDDG